MSAQIVALRPMPAPPPSDQMTYEEFKDFLNTLAVYMEAGHHMGDLLQKRKKYGPAIRVYGAVQLIGYCHETLTQEARTLKK